MKHLLTRILLLCIVLLPLQAFAAVNFGSSTQAGVTSGSLTVSVPAGIAANDVMIAAIAVRPSTITINTPAGWTLIRTTTQGTGSTNRVASYYRVVTGAEPASYTWTFSGANTGAVGGILSFSGVNTAAPIGNDNGQATGSSTNHTAPSVTTASANSMLVTIHEFSSAVAWTAPGGMTEAVDVPSQTTNAVGISMEINYEARPAAGATGTRTATAASDADTGATQSIALSAPLQYFSRNNGGWGGNGRWSLVGCGGTSAGGAQPGDGDYATICNGDNITLDTSIAGTGLLGLTINAGGELQMSNGNAARTLTVAGDITNAGTLSMPVGRNSTSALNVGGNIVSTGTFDFATDANSLVNTTFTGGGSHSITGSGAMRFNNVTVNNNLTINKSAGAITQSGTFTVNGNLAIQAGTLNLENAATVTGTTDISGTLGHTTTTGARTFTGNVTINSGGAWSNTANQNVTMGGNLTNNGNFTSGSGTYTFNGGAAQTLSGANGGTTTFSNLALNNTNGLALTGTHNVTVSTLLTLTSGRFTTGSNILFISNGSNIAGAGANTFVAGNLRKAYPAGNQTRVFEVGTETGGVLYAPVTLRFGNVTGAGNFTVSTTAGDHPQIAASTLDNTASINRYWTLANNSVAFAANANNSVTFTYNDSADYDSGADFNEFYVGRYDGSAWTELAPSARDATSVTISGAGLTIATLPGDHQIGERIPSTVTCNTVVSPGLPGDYFNNRTLSGSATGARTDGQVDFNWANGTPGVTGIGADQFSVRWSGILRATVSGNYQFQTVSDDGVRLWVGNTLVTNNWTDHASATNTSGVVALTAGTLYFIRLEYYENGGQAEIRLRWQPPSSSFTAIPLGPDATLGAGLYYCAPQVAGLSAHYSMDQISWNGTADEVTDISGNLRHGVSSGGATTGVSSPAITGSPGTCRYGVFDGSNDYVSVTNLSNILNGTASLAFWIKTSQAGNDLAWQAPGVTGVEQSGGADDIFWGWLDASGRIGISVGNTFTTKSTVAINDNAWHHVVLTRDHAAGTYKIYIGGSLNDSGAIATGTIGTAFASIGRIEDTGGTPMYFNGQLDEVKIYNYVLSNAEVAALASESHSCGIVFDHILIEHGSGSSLTCNPASLTIKACEDSGCSTFYNGGVTGTLTATGTPTVNWTGTADFTIPAGSSSVTKTLQATTTGSIVLGTTGVSPTPSSASTCNFGTPVCTFTATNSGFIFDVPDHIADTSQSVTISAVSTDVVTQKCVPAFQNTTTTVSLWSSYTNPNSGTQAVNINGSNISGSAPPGASNVNLGFDANGEVSVTVRYPDVGQMRLNARHTGSGDSAGLIMNGQDDFVTRPDHFTLTIPGNPAAADAGGDAFVHAGEDFTITVEARNASNAITPNYGRESTPETVNLTKTLVLPGGGHDPALTGSFGNFGLDCDGNAATAGAACGTFSWPEVGIISLEPSVSTYLNTADVTGTASGNIGRFIPNHFTMGGGTLSNRIDIACGASPFTYMGENLELGFSLTAHAAGGETTENYTGAFAKLDATDADDLNFGAIDTTGPTVLGGRIIPGTITGNWGNGTVNVLARVAVDRDTSPDGPFRNLRFGVAPLDSDSVALDSSMLDLDADNNTVLDSKRINPANADVRYGRLYMENAFGYELLPLTIPLRAEYAIGATQFTLNTDDSCTTYDEALLSFPIASASPVGFSVSHNSENGTLDQGKYGAVDPVMQIEANGQVPGSICASLDVPDYLEFNWAATPGLTCVDADGDPSSRATFGIYGGPEDNQIYIREVY
ncbi:MAG TPA: DUF6701 domain-containing protein [Gammaproteobacteria bacterium]|nr:DUF6701 domain-containing protein [Gammaproteobacteria bacterium]